jgi:hypothetical protein
MVLALQILALRPGPSGWRANLRYGVLRQRSHRFRMADNQDGITRCQRRTTRSSSFRRGAKRYMRAGAPNERRRAAVAGPATPGCPVEVAVGGLYKPGACAPNRARQNYPAWSARFVDVIPPKRSSATLILHTKPPVEACTGTSRSWPPTITATRIIRSPHFMHLGAVYKALRSEHLPVSFSWSHLQ